MSKPISTSFSGAIGVIETKIAALEKASNLAAEALEVRLHSMNEFRSQLKDQAASFVRREEHEHAQLSRQVKNISAFTPDRSPNLGLVRVLERAIKEAKADLSRRIGSEPRKRVVRQGASRFHFVPVCSGVPQTGTKWNLDVTRALSCLAC